MKNRHRAPRRRSANLHGRNCTEKPRLEKILPPSRPGRNFLSTVEQHPEIRTSSFVVFHIHLASLPSGPRSAIGYLRRIPHQRRNELHSHLQLKSRKGLRRDKCLPDTQHRVDREELVELPRAALLRRSVRPRQGAPSHTDHPTGLRPVRARASVSVAYSYTSMSHTYCVSF